LDNKNSDEAVLRLKSVIDTAIDGIITIDIRGKVETINPSAAKLFGYEPHEVIGNNIKMLMPNPYHSEHDGYIERYLATRKPRIIGIGREVQGMKKDGSIFPMRLAVSEVVLSNSKIFTGIIHDLTDIKVAQEKIIRLNKVLENKVTERTEKLAVAVNRLLEINQKLEGEIQERQLIEEALRNSEKDLKQALEAEKELSELKSRFVTMASHEFRTPLSTILSSIELIELYKSTEQQAKREKHINRIKTTISYLTSILNDFLSLSQLEEGNITVSKEYFAFDDFCHEVIDEMRNLLKKGQQLIVNSKVNKEIYSDKKILRHILTNLLVNSTKYTKEGKNIYCDAETIENQLVITIRDEGIGIPEADQKHLFTRFFRAHNVENIKGTGLGLNIVKHHVELLGGSISFESELGVGTIFRVELPVVFYP
jgi:two-component system, LuxR family, sensor kinase FixL